MSPSTVAGAFSRCISMEIDNHVPLDFEVIFEIAAEAIHPDTPDAVRLVDDLAEALDSMLQSARALA